MKTADKKVPMGGDWYARNFTGLLNTVVNNNNYEIQKQVNQIMKTELHSGKTL